MRFRADIEGLRGVAIAMVVLSHAGVPGLAGGFVGVDVFFVLSGFLITSLLVRELDQANTVDFWGFYARRAKRLVPALLVMLLIVGALAAAMLPTNVLLLQARTGMLAALWVSNFHFAFEKLDYFSPDATSSVFLHTWSLGVEEQFYLLWPLLLVIAWKWSSIRPRERLVTVVASVAVLGFFAAVLAHAYDPVVAYYLMPTRLWELALGGLTALVVVGRVLRAGRRAEWLRLAGLVLIVLGALVIRPGAGHLFVWLLLPVGGTALVLLAQDDAARPLYNLLASRVLRFLGRVSYAFYLWHWPLLGLARVLFGDQPLASASAVALALASAWMSTVWLEEPVRKLHRPDRKVHVMLGLSASLALVIGYQGWQSSIQREMEVKRGALAALLREQLAGPPLYKLGCDRPFKSAELFPCMLVDPPHATRRVLLLGDSVAAQWTPALEAAGKRRGWQVTTLTKAGCPIVDIPIHYARIGREYVECEQWRNRAADYINSQRFDLVIVASAATYDLTPDQWVSGTRSFLARTHRSTPDLVLLDPTPALPFNGLDCLIALDGFSPRDLDRCSVPLSRAQDPALLSALRRAAQPFSNVRHASLDALVCPDRRCAVLRDGQLVYRDRVHLNVPFVRRSADRIEDVLLRLPGPGDPTHLR